MEKYSKLSFILMISLIIFITAFTLRERLITSTKENSVPQISASEVKNLRQPVNNDNSTKYLLLLEGNTLFAYHIEAGTKNTVEKTEIEISSLTPEDIQLLKDGVYADSAEELFLYFESYTS